MISRRPKQHGKRKLASLVPASNPLRSDPTRLAGVRRPFLEQLSRQWDLLRGRLVKYLASDDGLFKLSELGVLSASKVVNRGSRLIDVEILTINAGRDVSAEARDQTGKWAREPRVFK